MADGTKTRKAEIREALQLADVKQLDLARTLSLSEPTISRILSGSYRMHDVRSMRTVVRVLRLVCAKTGLSLEDLARDRGIEAERLTRILARLDALDAVDADRLEAEATATATATAAA